MKRGDSFPKVRRAIIRCLRDGLAPFGFAQYGSTTYFIRDRGEVRDALFFTKMRSDAVCIAYGVSLVPAVGDWSPGLHHAQWLNGQEFFNCRYVERAERNMQRAVALFAAVLPYFAKFQSSADVLAK